MPNRCDGGKNDGDGKYTSKRGDNITRVHDMPLNPFSQLEHLTTFTTADQAGRACANRRTRDTRRNLTCGKAIAALAPEAH